MSNNETPNPRDDIDSDADVVAVQVETEVGADDARAAGESGEHEVGEPPTIEGLQQALERAQAESAENLDKALRATADLENLRKRSAREVENAHKFALERFLSDLLPVKDSLEMGLAAVDAAGEGASVESLREGSELTLKMMIGLLEKSGVAEVNPVDGTFDPELHQAMSMQDAGEGVGSGTIVTVIQKGYLLNERLLRPALVIVAK